MDILELPDDFGFTKDHDLLRQSVRRVLAERSPIERVRELDRDERGYDPALYAEMANLGWLGLALPEAAGGAELDALSQALVLEEMGRRVLPSPYFASVLAGLAMVDAGAPERCEPIATGDAIATVALTEPDGSWEPGDVAATAERAGDGYALRGVKTHVMWGAAASLVVAPFAVDGELALFALELPRDGVAVEPEVCVDGTRRTARLVFDGARVPASARLAGGLDAWRRTFVRGWALLAAEMVGGTEAVLGLTRDYAVERIQFGRPIGSFQAVKHPLVNVMIAVESARSLAVAAAAALDGAPARAEIPARMAKACATDTYTFATGRGVQLHGGFGFTYDCDVHFYLKRAMWSAATLGDAAHHRRHLASSLLPLQ